MTISFSGLASGLDTSAWVEAMVSVKKQKVTTLQTQLTEQKTVKSTLNDTRSAVSSLRTALEKITDAKFGGTFDLFGNNTAVSSNDSIFTATVTNEAARQTYDISVQQLATCTKATSFNSASAVADDDTKLSSLGVTKGALTVYVNGQKQIVDINDSTTLGDFKNTLATYGINTEVNENGAITFSAQNESDTIHFGATTDKSNFVSLVGLNRQEDGSYVSTNSVYKANISSKLTSADSGFKTQITEGTFTIGDAIFKIDANTTLSSLISDINTNDDAQAYAYWDDATGKLSITSTKEGASYINIEAGTSNFTDVMGLTQSEWDDEGTLISSKMLTDAQELGQNAMFTINGTSMISTSNTVTSDISRLNGVTLTLNKANGEEDTNTTLKVSQDTSGLKSAVNAFITAYNDCISKIDEVTANGADLHGETTLTSLRSTIRSYVTGSNTTNGGVYKLLSDIGITTASADANNISSDTNTLTLDEDKFLKALEEDPNSVKALLAGDNGIFNMIENSVEQSLKASVGFFDVKTSTIDSDISKIEAKITKQQSNISTYQKQLEDKFYKMELAISQMQQNYSSFLT